MSKRYPYSNREAIYKGGVSHSFIHSSLCARHSEALFVLLSAGRGAIGECWGSSEAAPTQEATSNYEEHLPEESGGREWGLCGRRAEPVPCPQTCQ